MTLVTQSTDSPSVRTLERALDLMEVLGRLRRPAGVRELETLTGIPKATAQRLLDVLNRRAYVQKHRGRYLLGPGTVHLARCYLSTDSLAVAAFPTLQQITALTGETAAIHLRQGFERLCVLRVESPHPLRYTFLIGDRLPLHLGAPGQVLAAAMPIEYLTCYLEQVSPIRLATGGIISKDEMLAKLDQVRRQGFAVGIEERLVGVCSVAAPIQLPDGEIVAALNVAGPSSRMTPEKIESLSLELRRGAREIAEKYVHLQQA